MVTLSIKETLYLQYATGTIRCFQDYKLLCIWLGCYEYIVPNDRARISKHEYHVLTDYIYDNCVQRNRDIIEYIIYEACKTMTYHYTQQEKERIVTWLTARNL
jgi:hypothetical protein